jgi:hypothetical protein
MGSFEHLVSSVLYFIGTFLLTPACILMLPFGNFNGGILILICACSYLTLGAMLDIYRIFSTDMPTFLEKSNVVFMLIGGVLFLTAAILYLPSWGDVMGMPAANCGTWVFRIGSISYLSGSCTSLYLVLCPPQPQFKYESLTLSDVEYCPTGEAPLLTPSKHHIGASISETRMFSSTTMWLLVILNYSIGAVLYIIGGIMFQYVHASIPGTLIWIAGSVLFVTGAFLQLYEVVSSFKPL